jgi:hypothetical protein
MVEIKERMTDGRTKPTDRSVAAWLGATHYNHWVRLNRFIDSHYAGVFQPEWLFGGTKYGWGLRFKKSKSFCTLIPERNTLAVQIVFGKEEREKVEAIAHTLSSAVRRLYTEAKTYHDGKWLYLAVEREAMLDDIEKLLAVKRKPKPQ